MDQVVVIMARSCKLAEGKTLQLTQLLPPMVVHGLPQLGEAMGYMGRGLFLVPWGLLRDGQLPNGATGHGSGLLLEMDGKTMELLGTIGPLHQLLTLHLGKSQPVAKLKLDARQV